MENPKTGARGGGGNGSQSLSQRKRAEQESNRSSSGCPVNLLVKKVASGRRKLALLLSFTRKVTRRCHYLWPLVSAPFLYTTPLERASPL